MSSIKAIKCALYTSDTIVIFIRSALNFVVYLCLFKEFYFLTQTEMSERTSRSTWDTCQPINHLRSDASSVCSQSAGGVPGSERCRRICGRTPGRGGRLGPGLLFSGSRTQWLPGASSLLWWQTSASWVNEWSMKTHKMTNADKLSLPTKLSLANVCPVCTAYDEPRVAADLL